MTAEDALTDTEVVDGMHDLAMMQRPHLWPIPQMLPLKRRIRTGAVGADLAVLTHLGGDRYSWALGTLMGRTGPNQPITRDRLAELTDAGWVVD